MLEITSHRHGELVNYMHGTESNDALTVEIRGIALPQSLVTINGIPARRSDRNFFLPVELREKFNKVTVVACDKFGERSQSITLVWDKGSFKRYAVRIDFLLFYRQD